MPPEVDRPSAGKPDGTAVKNSKQTMCCIVYLLRSWDVRNVLARISGIKRMENPMNDFIFHNPDRVYFGRNQMERLPRELLKYGKKVLLVYGGGAIRRNGLYDRVTAMMQDHGIVWEELAGVEPNPRHTTVNRGAAICREQGIEVVLAIGGGSVIDCAKGVAAAALSDTGDVWDFVREQRVVESALPVIAVLTNAATGSEMDIWAVISNEETREKVSVSGPAILPRAAFENPEDTYSLPEYQTACGSFDIFNHVLDNFYFAGGTAMRMILEFQEAVMRAVVRYAPVAMREPRHYEARANLMWASSMALNGVLDAGTMHAGPCHAMEHELSAYYDITHGHGLAILTPRWLTYILNAETAPEIFRLGVEVFGVDEGFAPMEGAKKSIEALSEFCFHTLGLKSRLSELDIDSRHFQAMAEHACAGGKIPGMFPLGPADVEAIYRMCL